LDKWTDSQLRHLSNDTAEWFNKNKATPDLLALAESLQEMLNDIHICHIEFKTLENTHRLISRNYRGFALLRDLQKNVEDICRQENSMLLSETKHAIAGFISESEAPFIYEKVGNYFDKFMIDEFQDTSVKEWNNFLPLLRNAMAQSTDTSVLIVGDVKQSIYRWRGGDWRILGGQIERELPDSKSKPLENNWRSLPNIVEFNTGLFNAVVERENSRMNTQLDEAFSAGRLSGECKSELYDTIARAYASHKQTARRKHKNCGYISIVAHPEDADKDSILFNKDGLPLYIERITEVLKKGFLPRDITILVRKNADGVRIAEELLHYREFLPKELWFDITTEEALSLASSPAVELIIAILRLAIDRKDATSLALYNHLHNNDYFDTQLDEEDNAFLDSIRMMSPEDAFEHITIRYADDLEGQTAYVLALHEQIVRFSAGRVADISLFEKWWSEKGTGLSVRVERSDRAIEILTIHKAKGLENKVIIMPHSSWTMDPISSTGAMTNIVWSKPAPNQHLTDIGEFPISFSSTVGESLFADAYFREVVYSCVDALNMLYVATTRAGEQLHIFLPPRAQRGYTVGNMLLDIYGSRLQQEVGANYRHYQIGTFDGPEIKEESSGKDEKVVATSVITTHSASPVKLKLNTSLSRYYAEEDGGLSPRSMGILLHRAFESASTREEIFAVLDEMALNGELGGIELPAIKAQISHTLDTTVAGEWFDGSWGELRRECSIIRPKAKTKRPDRVMTRSKEAVVLDYKFGEEMDSHHKQIAEYMAILHNMGYTSVKGYLWYVTTGKIKTVEG
jgi:ATP-dependent exoDNAse (exonuclease V) beta subunit